MTFKNDFVTFKKTCIDLEATVAVSDLTHRKDKPSTVKDDQLQQSLRKHIYFYQSCKHLKPRY